MLAVHVKTGSKRLTQNLLPTSIRATWPETVVGKLHSKFVAKDSLVCMGLDGIDVWW